MEEVKKVSPKKARRGRGESSVYQRADGQWAGSVSNGYDLNGKRRRTTVYAPTKKEVLEKLKELPVGVSSIPEARVMTVGVLLDRWLQTSKANLGVRTFEERQAIINNHIRQRIGDVKLSKLNALHVEGLYAELSRDGIGTATIRGAANVLGAVLNYAVGRKLIPANPGKAVPKPKHGSREMLTLCDEQAKAVITAAVGKPVYVLVVLALGTGMRQGELLALRWEDVDLRRGVVSVRVSLAQTRDGAFHVKEPKTAASKRAITLPKNAIQALTAHKAEAMQAGLLACPVFCTRTGNHLNKNNVLRAFRAVVKRANVAIEEAAEKSPTGTEGVKAIPEMVRFHDLRHTVASLLLSRGCSLKAVASRLGHANPNMTLRTYAHCLPNDDAQLTDQLNQMFA